MLVAGYRVLRRPRALHLEAATRRRGVVPGARRCHVGGAPSGRRCRAHAADQGNTTRCWSRPAMRPRRIPRARTQLRRTSRCPRRGRRTTSQAHPFAAPRKSGRAPHGPVPPVEHGTAASIGERLTEHVGRSVPLSAGHHRRRGHGEAESRQLQPPAQVDVLPHRQGSPFEPPPPRRRPGGARPGWTRAPRAGSPAGSWPAAGIARHSPVERRVVEARRDRVGARCCSPSMHP